MSGVDGMENQAWRLSGEIIHSCQCPVFCNNLLLREPLQPVEGQRLQLPKLQGQGADAAREQASGACNSITVWTIDRGTCGGHTLDGFSVVSLISSPGPLFSSGNWRRALYIDDRAMTQEREALASIFGGEAGGYFKRWKGWTWKLLGTSAVPIKSERLTGRRRITIPETLDLTVEPLLGGGDRQPFQLLNPPFWLAPRENPIVGRSVVFRYHDFGFGWQMSGRSACYSPFTYEGP